MKLNKDELQFIDTYLKNSEVKYLDIRMELTDHIASAVEEKMQSENLDFYDAFKEYMVVNKKELLKQDKYRFKQSVSDFAKSFLHPTTLIFIVVAYFSLRFLMLEYGNDFYTIVNVISLFYVIILLIVYIIVQTKRIIFSSIAHTGLTMFIFYQVFKLFIPLFSSKQGDESSLNLILGQTFTIIITTMLLVFIRYYFVQYTKYKKRYMN